MRSVDKGQREIARVTAIGEAMVELTGGFDKLHSVGFCGDSLNTAFKLNAIQKKASVSFASATGPVSESDPTNALFRDFLHKVGIKDDLVREIPSNIGLAICHARQNPAGEKIYTFYGRDAAATRLLFVHGDPDQYCQRLLTESDFLHTSLIAATIFKEPQQSRKRLIDLYAEAKKQGKVTIFDTNYRKGLAHLWEGGPQEAANFIKEISAHCTLILPGDEDMINMLGYQSTQRHEMAQFFLDAGAENVILKAGEHGYLTARKSNPTEIRLTEIVKAPVIGDTTAAGDYFNAGVIAAVIENRDFDLQEVAKLGHSAAIDALKFKGAGMYISLLQASEANPLATLSL